MTKAELQLEPLTCPTCVKQIETALHKTEGVIAAKVLFHSNKVKTEFDASQIDLANIANIIARLGYSVLNSNVS